MNKYPMFSKMIKQMTSPMSHGFLVMDPEPWAADSSSGSLSCDISGPVSSRTDTQS